MIELGRPGFLLAGALLALVPVLLHLIAHRPPERAPLPTARFLSPDPRTRVHLRRRPADPLLLALRAALILLLGAAFAAPTWVPPRRGSAPIVLLDRGAAMATAWTVAVDTARALLGSGSLAGTLILFDTAATVYTGNARIEAALDSLAEAGPVAASIDYGAALRALRRAAVRDPNPESARAWLVTRPRWSGWRPGLGALRGAVWPGAIGLVEPAAGADAGTARGPDAGPVEPGSGAATPTQGLPRRAVVLAPAGAGGYAAAALEALGADAVVRPVHAGDEVETADAYVVIGSAHAGMADSLQQALLAHARGGARVLVSGLPPAGPLADSLPWRPDGAGTEPAPGPLYGTALELDGAAERVRGHVPAGARVLAAWPDGRPAAVSGRIGSGCLVYLAAPLEAGRLPMVPEFPAAIERLLRGCEPGADAPGTDAQPLDAGARAVLAGEGAPRSVRIASLSADGTAGRPLMRWLLLAAAAAAALETWLAYGTRRHPHHGRP